MNIEQNLILIKGEDKTKQINYCKYSNSKWVVTFESGKTYRYSYLSVNWYNKPKIINSGNNFVYEGDKLIRGIVKIVDFGDFTRLIFKNGYNKVYPWRDLKIEEASISKVKSNNCFEYLKNLTELISVKDEEDKNFLSIQYEKLKIVNPRSVLATYLERKPLKNKTASVSSKYANPQPIFPFGFNLSQKAATENALTEHISVIEGPPGTGKTQTILNIISNAIVNGKTVAVVSNNNSATANVLEKLQKYGVDFIAAYLGNSENKEVFFSQQTGYPNMSGWAMERKQYESIVSNLQISQQKLNLMLKNQNELAALRQELAGFMTEQKYFGRYFSETNNKLQEFSLPSKFNSEKILSFMLDYQSTIGKGNFKLMTKLFKIFVYGIRSFKFYNMPAETVILFLQKSYYTKKIEELKRNIYYMKKELKNYNFNNAMKEYSDYSMKLFKAKLVERYRTSGTRPVFSKDVFWKNFDSFINEYPVILSTTHSLRNCTGNEYLFDYLIIDESSQVDIVSGALALSCAKSAVVVGDIKQLPNIVPTDMIEPIKNIVNSYNLRSAYDYTDNSLLSSILNLYNDVPRTLLREHYRCHPQIIGFCNQKFYNNELIVLTNDSGQYSPLVLYRTSEGNHARGRLNQRQIDVVFEEIIPNQNIDESTRTIGIISPYRSQANELKKAIGDRNIEADTVHKFQGRERDVIILTTVANQISEGDFADDPNLINVAVSRAVEKFIVVVSDSVDERISTNIGDLVRYIQYNNFEIIESQIYSVFDLLYSNYSEKLLKYIKNSRNVSEYKSENLMNTIIEEVLSAPVFQNLDRVLHQPLKMLIRNPSKLTTPELKYAMNIHTHTDFVIFNKLDKKPVLVVEVDGYAYHANNPKQLARDEMKDTILEKYEIPILRIKTNESGEANRLRIKLAKVLGIKVLV